MSHRIELVTAGPRVWLKVDGVDITGLVLADRAWLRFEDGVPILRVEMSAADVTAIFDAAKLEAVVVEDDQWLEP